ncbi:MAG: hypothetical protein ABS938_00120 [Psychrobacillus psychrodurans]
MEFNQNEIEKMKTIIRNLYEWFKKAVEQITSAFRKYWKWIKEEVEKIHHIEEKRTVFKSYNHKLNSTKQRMEHQVIDRKPRVMIRKIIH